jgi:peptidyl-prolyl cis-trans isomerase C
MTSSTMSMKTSPLTVILCAALAIGSGAVRAEEPTADTVIAKVNGTPYSLGLFSLFYRERLHEQGDNPKAFQEYMFNEFMSLIVATQEGLKRKLDQEDRIAAAIELQRMKIIANAELAAMAEAIEPTEDELKALYEEVKKSSSQTEYKARHILVDDEDEAKKLIAELDGGADFGELARKHSLGPTAKSGGELEWFDATQMVEPFAKTVAQMQVGSYTKQPVKTQFGWHVIRLDDSRKKEPPAFEDAKAQLTALFKRQKVSEKLDELRANAMVELNEEVVTVTPKDEGAADAK